MQKIPQDILASRVTRSMSFSQKVWAVTRRIPPGKVASYSDVAAALGGRACRAVGQALGRNPYAPDVPCRRVVASDGRLTGFAGGLAKKARLLKQEGVEVRSQRVDLKRFGFKLR